MQKSRKKDESQQGELPIEPHPMLMKAGDDPRPKISKRASRNLKLDARDAWTHRQGVLKKRAEEKAKRGE